MISIKNVIYICLIAFLFLNCKKTEKRTSDPIIDPVIEKVVLPILNTTAVTNVTPISAISGGTTTSNGGAPITERGMVLSINPIPTINDIKFGTTSVTGAGDFTSELTGLNAFTKYYIRAYAINKLGVGYGNEVSFTTTSVIAPEKPVLLLDSSSFDSRQKFEGLWNMFYPWGTDHNGSARMYKEQVKVTAGGVLEIVADRYEAWEGYSTADPWLRIFYHSGAVHLKEKIIVTEAKPYWEISGDFQVPSTTGTWPAFWITGASSWPPESDIMEFKGTTTNWQNTATGPDWQNVSWQNKLTVVPNPQNWHNYKITMVRMNTVNVSINYFIDNVKTATHTANFMDKPFWLIINMQMGGASGNADSSLKTAIMKGRNIYVAAHSRIP